jgi:hypothetical protein
VEKRIKIEKRSGQSRSSTPLGDVLASPEGKRKGRMSAAFVFALCMLGPMTASSDPLESPESSDGSKMARRGSGVGGVVRTASGEALRGVVVLAQSLDKPAPAIPDIAVTTNAAGSYFWSLRAGNYELTFLLNGQKIATRRVSVPAGGGSASVNLITRQ